MRLNSLVVIPLLLAAMGVSSGIARSAEPAGVAARPTGEEAAVRNASAAYRQSLGKKEVDAVTAFWTPEADYVDQMGRAYKIHAGLAQAKQLSQEGDHIAHLSPKTATLAVRFVTPDVAIEDGTFERLGSVAGPAAQGRYTAVWVKRNGKWLIDGVRESPMRLEDSTDALDDLAWIIGDWVAEGPQVTAEVSCNWGQNQTYIVSHLKIQPHGEKPVTATQLIGWDPAQQRIRSYLFDSRGSFTEGTWSNEGDAWVVKAIETHPNGKHVSSTRLYSRIDDDTAVWESMEDEPAGQPQTEMRLRLTRKKTKE